MKILYPKLVCFGYHFLENLPFSLHYCYVKITIFHPVVSKIKLRFYLKPGNREPMFECWDESGSEHPDMDFVLLVHFFWTTSMGRSPQSCTETDFEMKTSNFVLFLLISVVSVHFRAIYDETIRCQA